MTSICFLLTIRDKDQVTRYNAHLMCHPKKILFVCSYNQMRSCTAEKMYEGFDGYEVKSAGTASSARVRVTPSHLEWADIIFVMEKEHIDQLQKLAGHLFENKRIVNLDIDMNHAYMEPDLIEALRDKLKPHIDVPDVKA